MFLDGARCTAGEGPSEESTFQLRGLRVETGHGQNLGTSAAFLDVPKDLRCYSQRVIAALNELKQCLTCATGKPDCVMDIILSEIIETYKCRTDP